MQVLSRPFELHYHQYHQHIVIVSYGSSRAWTFAPLLYIYCYDHAALQLRDISKIYCDLEVITDFKTSTLREPYNIF